MTKIISHNLIFSRLSTDDFRLYSRLVINGEVMKYITGKALTTDEAENRFQKALQSAEGNPLAGFHIVKSKLNNEFIGVAKLVLIDEDQFEIGYMLLPEHWGKGFASEIVKSLVDFARYKQVAREIIGIVDPDNPASIKVLTKFGFRLFKTGQIEGLDAAYYKLILNESQ